MLKRTAYDTKGREIVLIDDLVKETPVVVSTLPKPTAPVISTQGGDQALAAALAAIVGIAHGVLHLHIAFHIFHLFIGHKKSP